MTRPIQHAAARPFRITTSAAEAHRGHASPFLGCPLCIRRSPDEGPRDPLDLAPPGLNLERRPSAAVGQRAPASESIRGGWAASQASSSGSFVRR